ncbi:MAG: tyrosine-type recombinase/integrase [Rhizobiales bacterium]|nr:tyrosine-type recombinase/integrase [Hyphomicrobiales bacterium]
MRSGRVRQKISKSVVDAAAPETKRYTIWDMALPGFGLTVAPSGLKTFIVRYRAKHPHAPKRFVKLGRYGVLTPEEARRKATAVLGEVAQGRDPAYESAQASKAITFDATCDWYMEQHVRAKRKQGTAALYSHIIETKLKPQFGKRFLVSISRPEVAQFHYSLRRTPAMANRMLAVLAAIYNWASRTDLIDENINPARKIEKFKETAKDRYLSLEELGRLGRALREAEQAGFPYQYDRSKATAKHGAKPGDRNVHFSPFAIAAIKLLTLTGCRVGEVLQLKWHEVDLGRGMLHLADSKTGRKTVLLGTEAIRVLASLPRIAGSEYVIAGESDGRRVDLKRPWKAIQRHAALEGVRLHDLRHSFASIGVGASLGLPIVGKLLGHTQSRTTERYAHLANDPLRRASELISSEIASAMRSPVDTSDKLADAERVNQEVEDVTKKDA